MKVLISVNEEIRERSEREREMCVISPASYAS
jgi:hypothetical protein